jgi:hypothetical protein
MKVMSITSLATELNQIKLARYYLMYTSFAATMHLLSWFTGK